MKLQKFRNPASGSGWSGAVVHVAPPWPVPGLRRWR